MKSGKIMSAVLSGCLAFSLLLAPAASAAESAQTDSNTEIINEIMDYIESYNVEGVDKDTLIRGAIDGMIYTLNDPYSMYLDSDEAAEFQHQLELEYVGIGFSLAGNGTEVYIEEITPRSPAEQAGLKRGDVLLKINGTAIADLEADPFSAAPGSKLTLTVNRNGAAKSVNVTLKSMVTTSVTGKIVGQNIAYISLNGFTQNADKEFSAMLDKMRAAGMKSLVLDLRNNGGGYIDVAKNITAKFMESGIMMYTSDQSGALTPEIIKGGSKIGVPVVVLTNENSASASEALTGALRDNKIATIVGTRTYGKARIQNIVPISNGGELKLTTLKYLTPNKEDFNHIGLKPDIEVQSKTAQLITALQIAGMTHITASGDNHILNINGSPFAGNVGLLKQGDKVYASARVLATLVESEVTWDAKNKKVLVTNGAGSISSFALASKQALSRNDETYIELNAFKKKFPALTWSYDAALKQLKLSVK